MRNNHEQNFNENNFYNLYRIFTFLRGVFRNTKR